MDRWKGVSVVFWIEFAMVLTAILLGIRRGGIALGLIGGLGVALLVFVFRAPPSEPPVAVMLIILAVVTASATLQVAGGLEYLVQLTERLLRAHPNRVTILAPLCTFFLTVCVGTGHAVYALFPVIADVALKTRIRPERPMAVSSVAAQMGITASPVAAAVTTFLGYSSRMGAALTIFDILKITLPAGIVGVIAAATWSLKRGVELENDPEFQRRMADPGTAGPARDERDDPRQEAAGDRQAFGGALLRRCAVHRRTRAPRHVRECGLPPPAAPSAGRRKAGADDHGGAGGDACPSARSSSSPPR
jgi:anaerobic C4-dicarboxylate transporter